MTVLKYPNLMLNISCVLFPHGADLLRFPHEVIRSSVPPNIKCGSVSCSWKQHRSFGNVFIQHLHPHTHHKGVRIQPASTHTRVPDAMCFTPHIHCHTLPMQRNVKCMKNTTIILMQNISVHLCRTKTGWVKTSIVWTEPEKAIFCLKVENKTTNCEKPLK